MPVFSTTHRRTINDAALLKVAGAEVDGVFTPSMAISGVVPTSGSFPIPAFNSQEFTYFGATNNIQTQVFKSGGTTVATLTFTYVGGGASDDDLIASITQS